MTFSLTTEKHIYCSEHDHYIPISFGNLEYQAVLDAIIEEGESCFDGDIPAELQAAADEKKFNQQLAAYRIAAARLEQYVLADGRQEVKEMQPTGEQIFNEETGEMEDVMAEVVIQTAIEPLEPTVDITVYNEEDPMAEPTIQTIENPEITQDNQERTAAQAIVDATPQDVKDQA